LKVTALVPWVDPKLLPEIDTAVPTAPAFGDRLMIVGAPDAETVYGISAEFGLDSPEVL
jgi:hypothetical protein